MTKPRTVWELLFGCSPERARELVGEGMPIVNAETRHIDGAFMQAAAQALKQIAEDTGLPSHERIAAASALGEMMTGLIKSGFRLTSDCG